jgi:glycosyltransferase involved in cell wall biosynthesis
MRPSAFAIPGDIATVTGGYIYERRLLEELRARGREVAHLQLPDDFLDLGRAEMDRAIDILRRVPPDCALILDGFVSGAADTAGLARARAPLVAVVHHPLAFETGLDAATRDRLFRTERDNLALMAHILVPSAHTADILVGRYGAEPGRITVAPPGTDAAPRPRRPSRPPLILSVGLLHPRKGHDVLLRALHRIADTDWRCVIVGAAHDADCAATLETLVRENELTDRVTLAGFLPDAALDALYAEATLFALATRYEGYGMVFDEATAWGLPIVTCATGAVPQTVPEGAALLVPPDAPDAFAAALRRILAEADLSAAMAARSAEAGRDRPGWADTAAIAGAVLDGL